MKTLYLNPYAGVAGDMLVGALLQLGADTPEFWQRLRSLPLPPDEWQAAVRPVMKRGISAYKFDVTATDHGHAPEASGIHPAQLADLKLGAPVPATPGQAKPHQHVLKPGSTHSHSHSHSHSHTHSHGDGDAHSHTHTHGGHAHSHDDEHGHTHEHSHSHDDGHAHGHSHAHHDHDHVHGRSLPEIEAILQGADLGPAATARALAAFRHLADAEAAVHGVPPDQVHFHEVGAVDAIVDIAGACLAWSLLGVQRTVSGPVATGSGTVVCAHGLMPVPAPATALLLRGVPTVTGPAASELCTPTGAALLKALVDDWSAPIAGTLLATGYGAGNKDFPTHPNIVTAVLYDTTPAAATTPSPVPAAAASGDGTPSDIVVLSCNLDDMPGERLSHLTPLLLASGALDVCILPCLMKKGRQGMQLQVQARPADREAIARLMLRETSSFGVRWHAAGRIILDRRVEAVDTPHGSVQVKLGIDPADGEILHLAPEYESCHHLAIARSLPLSQIYDAALAAAVARFRP